MPGRCREHVFLSKLPSDVACATNLPRSLRAALFEDKAAATLGHANRSMALPFRTLREVFTRQWLSHDAWLDEDVLGNMARPFQEEQTKHDDPGREHEHEQRREADAEEQEDADHVGRRRAIPRQSSRRRATPG